MKRGILFVLAALIIALLVYRFTERRKVEATLTIRQPTDYFVYHPPVYRTFEHEKEV